MNETKGNKMDIKLADYTTVVMESPTTGIQYVAVPTDTLKSILEIYKEHGFKILSV